MGRWPLTIFLSAVRCSGTSIPPKIVARREFLWFRGRWRRASPQAKLFGRRRCRREGSGFGRQGAALSLNGDRLAAPAEVPFVNLPAQVDIGDVDINDRGVDSHEEYQHP